MLMLPAFRNDARVRLVAACAPRAESRNHFAREFGGRTYEEVSALAADPEVEAVYIATPHQLHAEHAVAVARAGKHILLDKPLAVSMEDGRRIVEAAEDAGVHLIVGPSHSFDTPVAQARALIDSGEFGRVRMIQALNYTDFLYRPRRPEELRTRDGGGVIFSQGIHQIDLVRLLAGGRGQNVMAVTGAWDPDRPTEGAYSALVTFGDGCAATLTYSGYAHFDSDIWMDGIGELGARKDVSSYGRARLALSAASDADDEIRLKSARTYGTASRAGEPDTYEHFGPVIVLCDRADLRLTPFGIHVCGDMRQEFRPAPPFRQSRAEVVAALFAAVREGRAPVQTGRWGLASLELCHAILESAATGKAVRLKEQVAYREER
ncbi:MAG: Gfo/Idh/MocA family oxidoreductase [Rhizobiaceae bacterium]|nr:Gfo/Idh/MocA family oxidoreductase [Rhizobiaceae bacterium]MCV0407112.1 Gfo/Idh/MocA family oxidoreductase [Rhizobiaceae bacterium]